MPSKAKSFAWTSQPPTLPLPQLATKVNDSLRGLMHDMDNLPKDLAFTNGAIRVDDFNAVGNGQVDDTAAIQAAENTRTAGQVLQFTAGLTYRVNSTLKVKQSGRWNLNGAKLKYGGTTQLRTGSDGGGIPFIAVLAGSGPWTIGSGILDGNNLVEFALGFESNASQTFSGGLLESVQIQNLLENAGESSWSGIVWSISKDVTGNAISSRSRNISGFIIRPQCPLMDTNLVITGHADLSALLIGGSAISSNSTGCAIVMSSQIAFDQIQLVHPSVSGVPAFQSEVVWTNTQWQDLALYDLGCHHIELYGFLAPVPRRQTFTANGTYTPQLVNTNGTACSNEHFVTVAENVAVSIADAANDYSGGGHDRAPYLRFIIANTTAAGLSTAVTFTGVRYKSSGSVSPGSGQRIVVSFIYDFGSDLYIETSRGVAV